MTPIHCSQIWEPWLYLGNLACATNEAILKQLNIRRIVTVMEEDEGIRSIGVLCRKLRISHRIFPITDGEFTDPPSRFIKTIIPFLATARKREEPTLVHCRMSISRSPSTIITFFVWEGQTFREALINVVGQHLIAHPRPDVLSSFLKCIGKHLPVSYGQWWNQRNKALNRLNRI
jgi:hypothetical protein